MTSLVLTPAERGAITAYIRLGTVTAVANELGRSAKTLETHLKRAREKNGGVTLLQLAVLTDREDPQLIEPVYETNSPRRQRPVLTVQQLEAALIHYFARNPDEELTAADISAKYGFSNKTSRILVKDMSERGVISRRPTRHGKGRGAGRLEYVYMKAPEA